MTDDREQLEALLADYIDGNLDAQAQRELEAYLDANPDVRAVVESAMVDSEALRTFPRVNAPIDFSEDFRGQVERDLLLGAAGDAYVPRRRFAGPVVGAAAMLVIGLGIAGGAYWLIAKRPTPFIDVAFKTPELSTAEQDKPTAMARADSGATQPAFAGRSPTAATDVREVATAVAPEHELAATVAPPADGARTPRVTMAAPAITMPGATGDATAASRDRSPTEISFAATAQPVPAPPPDVRATLGMQLDPARRSVVWVVDADNTSAASAIDRQFSARASLQRAGGLADAKDEGGASAESRLIGGAAMTNVAPSPVSNAIGVSSLFVARSVAPTDFDELQSAIQQLPAGATFARYETPADAAKQKADQQGSWSHQPQAVPSTQAVSVSTTKPAELPLGVGDRLVITLTDPDAFNLKSQYAIKVDDAGTIELPSLKGIKAAGQSLEELRDEIVLNYQSNKLMRDPIVSVRRAEDAGLDQLSQQVGQQETQVSGLYVPAEKKEPGALAKDGLAEPLDVFVLVRSSSATTQPTTAPATAPATQP